MQKPIRVVSDDPLPVMTGSRRLSPDLVYRTGQTYCRASRLCGGGPLCAGVVEVTSDLSDRSRPRGIAAR